MCVVRSNNADVLCHWIRHEIISSSTVSFPWFVHYGKVIFLKTKWALKGQSPTWKTVESHKAECTLWLPRTRCQPLDRSCWEKHIQELNATLIRPLDGESVNQTAFVYLITDYRFGEFGESSSKVSGKFLTFCFILRKSYNIRWLHRRRRSDFGSTASRDMNYLSPSFKWFSWFLKIHPTECPSPPYMITISKMVYWCAIL